MSISKSTTDITTLKINYLTQEMYDAALANNQINENELYVTPNEPEFTVENQTTRTVIFNESPEIVNLVQYGAAFNEVILNYADRIDADTLVITFNGIEYECPRYDINISEYPEVYASYGGEYGTTVNWDIPFVLVCSTYTTNPNYVYIEPSIQSVTIKAEISNSSSTVTTSSDFSAAVNHVIDSMKIEGGSY